MEPEIRDYVWMKNKILQSLVSLGNHVRIDAGAECQEAKRHREMTHVTGVDVVDFVGNYISLIITCPSIVQAR